MANFHQATATVVPWNISRINCAYEHASGTGYLAAPDALQRYGPADTARFLSAVGYCALEIEKSGNTVLIGRINRTAWCEQLKDIAFGTREELPKDADTYRRYGPSDQIRGVPAEVAQYLLESTDPRAPTVLMAKNDVLSNLKPSSNYDEPYENPAMPLTNDTKEAPIPDVELDLKNLPVLEAMPMKVVVVVFSDSGDKEYHFFAPVDAAIGDHCVVYSQGIHKNSGPFSIGRIERESADLEGRARNAILGTFNEAFALHVQKRMDYMASIKAKLQQKKRQFEEQAFYELMAEKDPETAELLAALKQFRV